jgi:DNA-binding beta-propeller fold protein YncE
VESGAGCPGAIAAVSSDYASTNVSVLSTAGRLLSESIISSGSAPSGLTTALSADVVLPTVTPASGRLVLIDRYPNSVLTWVDPATAAVLAQLSVGTGFASNPYDYLELDATKAYVPRLESNPHPGSEPNDAGGDLLIVDTERYAIAGSISLAQPDDGSFLPHPARLLAVNGEAWVVLERFEQEYGDAGDGRLVGVSPETDSVLWSLDLPGVANCGALALDPAGQRVAVACSGVLERADTIARSAVVLLDATVEPPVELARFDVGAELGSSPGPTLAWASDSILLGATYGDLRQGTTDLAYALELTTGSVRQLLDGRGAAVLGDALCAPGCSDICFMADAHAKVLRGWQVDGDQIARGHDVAVDPGIGLPPRALSFLMAK